MPRVVDGIIQAWDERIFRKPTHGRRPKRNLQGGKISTPNVVNVKSSSAESPRKRLERITSRIPEVMVKISGGGKNIGQIKAHFSYISRKGDIVLEDENGELYNGADGVLDARDAWAMGRGGIPKQGGVRREAFNIILSMPPGTDREAVTKAARQFALIEFANHQYVMAAHADEDHPHVHLCVKAVDREGVRLNPRKADLQRWRETFADKLHDEGIIANATPRRARSIVRKGEKQAVRWIDKGYKDGKRREPSRARTGRDEAIRRELAGVSHVNPLEGKITTNRKNVIRAYGDVARVLAESTDDKDRRLAVKIVHFVRAMPPVETQLQAEVAQVRRKQKQEMDKDKEKE